ncbi:MAG: sel1 repeat family protein, partial [Actinomycetes bacterium]
AARGDPESAYHLGLLLIAEHDDVHGGGHWFRRAAAQGHRRAAQELGTLLTALGRPAEAERWLAHAPAPACAPAVDPEPAARAELAAAAAGRRCADPIDPDDLVEILGTWEHVARRLREPDAMRWLAGKDDRQAAAIECLEALRTTVLCPGSAPWPTAEEVRAAVRLARELRARLNPN